VLLLVAALVLFRRTRALSRRLAAMTRGEEGSSLEDVLSSHLRRVHEVSRGIDELDTRTAVLERDLRRAFGRIGLVRYNPFEDTGGNQSFALAVLDGHGDGFVVSSLHARQGTRVYAKAIAAGTSTAGLSAEETEALRQAMAAPAAGGSAGAPSAPGAAGVRGASR
jgi:hypothetical protein